MLTLPGISKKVSFKFEASTFEELVKEIKRLSTKAEEKGKVGKHFIAQTIRRLEFDAALNIQKLKQKMEEAGVSLTINESPAGVLQIGAAEGTLQLAANAADELPADEQSFRRCNTSECASK